MTLRTITAAALVALASAALAGAPAPETSGVRYFAGSIGKHRVFAAVEIDGGKLEGEYAYGRIPHSDEGADGLRLQGTVAPDGALEIDEFSEGAVGDRMIPFTSGHFSGRLDASLSRLTGTWTPRALPEGSNRKPLAFDLTAFAQAVGRERPDGRRIGGLEFLDGKSELVRVANEAVRAHAEEILAAKGADGRGSGCDYAPVFYSDRVVSVLCRGSRDHEFFHEGLVFGYRNGKPDRLGLGDILALDDDWPTRLDALVAPMRKPPYGLLNCPYQLNGFAVAEAGVLHLYVGCKPGAGRARELDVPIAPGAFGPLRPDGPAASVLKRPGKR